MLWYLLLLSPTLLQRRSLDNGAGCFRGIGTSSRGAGNRKTILPMVPTTMLTGTVGHSPTVIASMGVAIGAGKLTASSAMGVGRTGKVEPSPEIVIHIGRRRSLGSECRSYIFSNRLTSCWGQSGVGLGYKGSRSVNLLPSSRNLWFMLKTFSP